jgi:hypothetical protein
MSQPRYPHITIDISKLSEVAKHRQLGIMVVDALKKAGIDRSVISNYSDLSMSLSIRSLREYTEKLVYVVE